MATARIDQLGHYGRQPRRADPPTSGHSEFQPCSRASLLRSATGKLAELK